MGECVVVNPADVSTRAFDAAHWSPVDREYGILMLLVSRAALKQDSEVKPAEIETFKTVESRLCSSAVPVVERPARRGKPAGGDESEGEVSEGEPYEETEAAAWPGKPGWWFRVNAQLGEEVIVRGGVSLTSCALRRVAAGGLVQQAGRARALLNGRAKGCVRLPVKPSGWVTADASKAGGPKYLVRAGAPRWRAVHDADVIVRAGEALNSSEVAVLHRGDIVEQAGPEVTLAGEIVRVPVTMAVIYRSEIPESGEWPEVNGYPRSSTKTLGWVTLDASGAGGPVFFEGAYDNAASRRRRQKAPHGAA